MLSIFLVHFFIHNKTVLLALRKSFFPTGLKKCLMCSTYRGCRGSLPSWWGEVSYSASYLLSAKKQNCEVKLGFYWKMEHVNGFSLQYGSAEEASRLSGAYKCLLPCVYTVCVCMNLCIFLHICSIYLYLCLNVHAFHHVCVCFCLYFCIFICSSLCHLFCLIMCVYVFVCMCMCMCVVWSSACRHCNVVVYFHIYDTVSGSCVTHLQFVCIWMWVCGWQRRSEAETHQLKTQILGSSFTFMF